MHIPLNEGIIKITVHLSNILSMSIFNKTYGMYCIEPTKHKRINTLMFFYTYRLCGHSNQQIHKFIIWKNRYPSLMLSFVLLFLLRCRRCRCCLRHFQWGQVVCISCMPFFGFFGYCCFHFKVFRICLLLFIIWHIIF